MKLGGMMDVLSPGGVEVLERVEVEADFSAAFFPRFLSCFELIETSRDALGLNFLLIGVPNSF